MPTAPSPLKASPGLRMGEKASCPQTKAPGVPLPHTGEQPAEEESAIALHEGGEEGKDAVDRE